MEWIHSHRIYLKDRLFDGSIGMEKGKILALEKGCHEEAVDYGNRRIIPGLIDTHNHGTYGWSCTDDPSLLEVSGYLKALAAQGTTAVFPTAGANHCTGIVAAARAKPKGARIVGIHYEGPYLHRVGEKGIPQPAVDIDMAVVRRIVQECQGLLKLMGHAPELKNSDELIDYLVSQGIKAAITHTDGDAELARHAIDRGITVATHTGNVMRGIHHRNIGTLGMCLLDDRVMCEAIMDGMHLSLDMVALMLKTTGTHRMMAVSDCSALSGLKPGTYFHHQQEIIVYPDGFVKTATGRLMGSSQPVLKGLENVVEKLGLDLSEALYMFGANQAAFYGIEGKGWLDIGMDADFVVLEDDYQVVATYVEGQAVYRQGQDTALFNEKMIL